MVLGIISTLNLGQAVQERIRLQNAADAAAYSLAVEEARLFNFFAFTNRAQVAHYSAAMTIQSYVSYMTYVGAVVGTLRDLIWDTASVHNCVCQMGIVVPPVSPPYCTSFPIFANMGNLLTAALTQLQTTLVTAERIAGQLIDAMQIFNRVIWGAQLYQGLMLNLVLTSGGYPYVWANAPEVGFGVANGLNALFNQLEFYRVFDRGAGVNFSLLGMLTHPRDVVSPRINNAAAQDPDVVAARQVMTEIANASRWGPPGPFQQTFVTDRSLTLPVPSIAGVAYLFGAHGGQTRLVGNSLAKVSNVTGLPVRPGVPLAQLRTPTPLAMEPLPFDGSILASDDFLLGTPYAGGSIFFPAPSSRIGSAVVAGRTGGGHYGYNVGPQRAWVPGLMRLPPDLPRLFSPVPWELGCCAATPAVPSFPLASNLDYLGHVPRSHRWQGITPYAKFAPSSTPEWDYRQPSTWVFLNMPPEHFNRRGAGPAPGSTADMENLLPHLPGDYSFGSQGGHRPWSMELEYTFGDRTARLDTTPGSGNSALLPMFRGLNAVSRGQVYYHRPRSAGRFESSNWTEHPNFFNPYWRARLAPVGLKLVQVYDYLISGRMHVATSNPVVAGGVNFLRNSMSEVFFHVVTSVMTH
jgi:hypothetical protein